MLAIGAFLTQLSVVRPGKSDREFHCVTEAGIARRIRQADAANFTLLHSGCDANFRYPCKSGSCSISDGRTAGSVTCWRLLLVEAWPRLKKPPPSFVVMCSRVISRSPISLLAKRAVPPPSDAEHLRIKVLPQFSTIVCASAWP